MRVSAVVRASSSFSPPATDRLVVSLINLACPAETDKNTPLILHCFNKQAAKYYRKFLTALFQTSLLNTWYIQNCMCISNFLHWWKDNQRKAFFFLAQQVLPQKIVWFFHELEIFIFNSDFYTCVWKISISTIYTVKENPNPLYIRIKCMMQTSNNMIRSCRKWNEQSPKKFA